MLVTRALKLAIFPNVSKLDAARYTYEKHLLYAQHFVTQLYFAPHGAALSTSGMGGLANKAQHRARNILAAHRAATKATDNKSNVPKIAFIGCPAAIEVSKDSIFDYWLKVESQFSNKKTLLPVKSHKRLNQWLKRGYALNPVCEFVKDKNGKFYALVFVQKEVEKAHPKKQSLMSAIVILSLVVTAMLARTPQLLLKNKDLKKRNAKDKLI